MSWYCYIIKSTTSNKTYNGSTNDPIRRLRQHNGEICGGAYRTKTGRPWEYYALLKGMPNHINCLSCEWRIRYPNNRRKKEAKYRGVNGRIVGLNEVLKLDRWTKQCQTFNKEMELELWIQKGYDGLITDLPENIRINIVDRIDPEKLNDIF